MDPVNVKFRIPDKSLLESTTNALEAVTVPAVTPDNAFRLAAVAVTIVPPNFNPFVPL